MTLHRSRMIERLLNLDVRMPPRRAFTLAEVIIVVLITSILAVIAVPRYADSIDRFRAEAAAKRIAADMNLTRERAMTRSTQESINFFAVTDQYQMVNGPDIDHSSQEYWVDFAHTPYPVDLVSATFINMGGATNTVAVVWDMNGRAQASVSPPGSGKPLASGEVVVAAGIEQRTVVIDPVTGEARLQ